MATRPLSLTNRKRQEAFLPRDQIARLGAPISEGEGGQGRGEGLLTMFIQTALNGNALIEDNALKIGRFSLKYRLAQPYDERRFTRH